MALNAILQNLFSLPNEATEKLQEASILTTLPSKELILNKGQYIKYMPIVIKGLVKVFTRDENKDFLLYYIQPGESCVMSYHYMSKNKPCLIYAQTEEETEVLLIPISIFLEYKNQYLSMYKAFCELYQNRYYDLMTRMESIIFNKLEDRILLYLSERSTIKNQNPLKISHNEIALDLGTSREIVSRILKTFQEKKIIIQKVNSIELLFL